MINSWWKLLVTSWTPYCSPAHRHKSSTTHPPPQPTQLPAHQSIHPPIHHTLKPPTTVSPKSERPRINLITLFYLVKISLFVSHQEYILEAISVREMVSGWTNFNLKFQLFFFLFSFSFIYLSFLHPQVRFFLVVCHPRMFPGGYFYANAYYEW